MFKRLIQLLCLVLLSGCWDRTEINDVAFVAGTGVDMRDDKYLLTIQIPLPGQMGGAGSEGGGGGTSGGKSWYNEMETADSLRKANELQQKRSSRKLYYAHRRVVLFGEDVAKNGVDEILDIFVRVPQNRLTAYVLIAKDQASDVLSADVPIEKNPSEMVRELTNFSFKHPRNLLDFTHYILAEGKEAVLPVVSVEELPREKEKKTIEIGGLAVFNNTKLAGILEKDNAAGLLWAMNEAYSPEVVLSPPEGKGEITLRFPETSTDIVPEIKDENITVTIKISAKGTIIENQSNFDTTTKSNLSKLEYAAEEKIKEQVKKAVELLQDELHSDAIGFGHRIYLKNPKKWKEIKERWDELYSEVGVEVQVNAHIEHTGSLNIPFGVKEEKQVND